MPQEQNHHSGGYIDAHCHLADERWEGRLDEVLARSRAAGVTGWIQGGVAPADWARQLALRARLGPRVLVAFGLHPWWVAAHSADELEAGLVQLERDLPKAHALGELGLDFLPRHAPPASHALQREAFERQLVLAAAAGKPLVLHVVKAHEAALELLARHAPYPAGGIVHSFSAAPAIARRYLDLGFSLSLGGSLTWGSEPPLKKELASFPRDRIVIETDAPDQAPRLESAVAGTLNEPANLCAIADFIASWLGMNGDALLRQSRENLERLFGRKAFLG